MKKFLGPMLLFAASLSNAQTDTHPTLPGDNRFAGANSFQSLLTAAGPFVCIESYMTGAMNGDYGQAITAAVQAQPLTKQTTVKTCVAGDHSIASTAHIDRPIDLDLVGSRLVPTAAFASKPVTILGATVTSGKARVRVSSTSGLLQGQAVGGLGIIHGSYITALGPDNITLSLAPRLSVLAVISNGSTSAVVSSLVGLTTGQSVSGTGIPDGTTISALNPATQTITLSNAATQTPTNNGFTIPITLNITSTWTTSLVAVKTTPVISWDYNADALHNEYRQMIGGRQEGVWIDDTAIRSIRGVQGEQFDGWDRFQSTDYTADHLYGSGMVFGHFGAIGPQAPIRESYFYNTKIRNSGDPYTGQAAMELITASGSGDEINQVVFDGGQLVTNFSENLEIGTYVSRRRAGDGPRLVWFTNNLQIEGGDFLSGYSNTQAQYDSVHVNNAGDLYINGAELNGEGYGKSLIHVVSAQSLSITNTRIQTNAQSQTYTVSVSNGSPTVKFVSGQNDGWPADGSWNGIAVTINGTLCYLSPSNGTPNSTTMTLAAKYAGATSSSATLVAPFNAGYGITLASTLNSGFHSEGNSLSLPSISGTVLGVRSTEQLLYAGSGFSSAMIGTQQYGGSYFVPTLNAGTLGVRTSGDAAYLDGAAELAPNLGVRHVYQHFFGVAQSTNNSFETDFYYAGPGSASNHLAMRAYGGSNSFTIDGNGNVGIAGHLNQPAAGRFAGTCAMSAGTSCTFILAAAFSRTPVCIPAVQGSTAIAGACSVSGTSVTITAASSNSQTWGAVLIGNPN